MLIYMHLATVCVMFALAELYQATYFGNGDADSREITGSHRTELGKNAVITF